MISIPERFCKDNGANFKFAVAIKPFVTLLHKQPVESYNMAKATPDLSLLVRQAAEYSQWIFL